MFMDTISKIQLLGSEMQYEAAEDHPNTAPLDSHVANQYSSNLDNLKKRFPVTNAALPNGKTIRLLKTMQSSVCERDCNYCCFRSGRDTRRASLSSDELAEGIVTLSKAGIAEGVFLSSGLAGGGVRTQDRIIATAEILRLKLNYQGYVHLKIMPGAEKDQILRAMQLADRVSVNLEAPNPERLAKLAPHKVFMEELLQPLRWIEELRNSQSPLRSWKKRWPSSCTQFVVGCAGETDLELLSTTAFLRSNFKIARAYYSGFSPVSNTPFENLPAINSWRQHRLYQAFFLMRDYKFDLEEIHFSEQGNLSLEIDPKLAWADQNLVNQPIELNTAGFDELIKIPGVGPKTARVIIHKRRIHQLRDITQIKQLGISINRARKYILLDGQRPPYQIKLFSRNV